MTGPGLMALPEGDRLGLDALRVERRLRLLRAVRVAGLDALILGRPGDIAFAVGSRPLFTTGSRPFSPGCVIVGDETHVLADHDEGVPPELPRDHLFGRAWNPVNAAARVAALPGLADARRIGTAGTSRGVVDLLASVAPSAEVVDARALLRAVREPKSPAEVAVIRTACAIAEAGLEAMRHDLRPGVTTRQLAGRYAERLGQLGITVIPDGVVAHRTALGASAGLDDTPLGDGELVSLSPSVTYAGYDATLARTLAAGRPDDPGTARLRDRTERAVQAVIDACRPGASGADLVAAWAGAGEVGFGLPLAHGVGMGVEEPMIGVGVGADERLARGVVLAVQGWVHEEGVGSWHRRDLVHVTDAGPVVLTPSRPGPSTSSSPGALP